MAEGHRAKETTDQVHGTDRDGDGGGAGRLLREKVVGEGGESDDRVQGSERDLTETGGQETVLEFLGSGDDGRDGVDSNLGVDDLGGRVGVQLDEGDDQAEHEDDDRGRDALGAVVEQEDDDEGDTGPFIVVRPIPSFTSERVCLEDEFGGFTTKGDCSSELNAANDGDRGVALDEVDCPGETEDHDDGRD